MFRVSTILMRLLARHKVADKVPAGVARHIERLAAHRGLRRSMRKFRL